MNPELIDAALNGSSIALVFAAFGLLIHGSARSVGESFRTLIEPLLLFVRDSSACSRTRLADLSILAAMGLGMSAALTESLLAGVAVASLLWLARPAVHRATREEHRLLATASFFSLDVVIGVNLPVAMAHLLIGNIFLAMSLVTIAVALSWPAGGGETIPGRRWRIVPA